MKIAVSVILFAVCVQATLARRDQKKSRPESIKKDYGDAWNKGKREAAIQTYSYPGPPRTHMFHLNGGSSLNVGAGYSFGGSKSPYSSYSGSFGGSHFPSVSSVSSGALGLGHTYGGRYQPITANLHSSYNDHAPQPTKTRYTSISGSYKNPIVSSGGKFGAFFGGGSQSSAPHFSLSNTGPQSFGHSQLLLKPQMTYGTPQYAAFSKPEVSFSIPATFMQSSHASLPAYAAGTHGLGAYASSSSPVISGPLFSPASTHESPSVTYGAPSSSFGAPSHGNQLSTLSFGSGSSFGDHGGSSSNKFAGFFSGNYKPTFESHPPHGISSSQGSSTTEFKPSLYLGSSEASPSSSHESTSYSHQSPQQTLAASGIPASAHSALLSGTPIYLAPKAIADVLKSSGYDLGNTISIGGSQGTDFQSSASLTGSHSIPSAGHAASLLSFGGASEHYSSPSVSYGAPAGVGHDSDSSSYSSAPVSHGVISGNYGTPVSHTTYESPVASHSSSSSFGGFSSNHGSPSISYSSINHAAPSSSYGTPSHFSDSSSFNSIGSFGKGQSFSGLGTSSFTTSNLSDQEGPKEVYIPQKTYGPPKGSYSTKSNVYTSAPSEHKYDTIKYSRDIAEGEILHN